MIILAIIGCLHALQGELTARCQRYGISLNDCLNSVYLPKREYDEYLQSFNLPIIRDASCNKGRCMAVVYKDTNRCANCKGGECGSGCSDPVLAKEDPFARLSNEYRREPEPRPSLVHVIHHKEPSADGDEEPVRRTEAPSVSYKSITVIETRTETVSEQPSTSTRTEERNDVRTIEATVPPETRREEVRTVFRTIDIPQGSGSASRGARPWRTENQIGWEDKDREVRARQPLKPRPDGKQNRIPTSVRRSEVKSTQPEPQEMDEGEESKETGDEEAAEEPKIVTVTRVFYKTVSVEKPITLYREVTTTVKSEVPIINYKLTTIKEVSTATKTESSTTTETVMQTQYSVVVSTKTQYGQEASGSRGQSVPTGPQTISVSKPKKDDGKDAKEPEGSGNTEEKGSISAGSGVIYKTVTKPVVSILTITKVGEKGMLQSAAACSDGPSSEGSRKEDGPTSTVGQGIATRVCTESCSTVVIPKASKKKAEASSTAVSPASVVQDLGSIGKQDIIAELLPLVRKVLMEDAESEPPLSFRKPTAEGKKGPGRTTTKTVVRTVEKEVKNRGGAKTVYNTIYSYKKRPGCRKGVEGRRKRTCKGPGEEIVTTVYV